MIRLNISTSKWIKGLNSFQKVLGTTASANNYSVDVKKNVATDTSTYVESQERQAPVGDAISLAFANLVTKSEVIEERIKTNEIVTELKKSNKSDHVSTLPGKVYQRITTYKASKLCDTLPVQQVIQVMKDLAESSNRSLELMKKLTARIAQTESLNIKDCSNVLYAMATLKYQDELILDKLSNDIIPMVPDVSQSAVIGSIFRSFGTLGYRNCNTLKVLTKWIESNIGLCRTQDLVSALMSLATLNYRPENDETLIQEFKSRLTIANVPDTITYLDVVWSLVLLGCATPEQISNVLSSTFEERLKIYEESGKDAVSSKLLKLANIQGYATNLLSDYKGPQLQNSNKLIISKSNSKKNLINSVVDAISNLLPLATYLKRDVDTGAGFCIDAEFLVDSKGTPLTLAKKNSGPGIKIAVMVLTYQDLCRGTELTLNGLTNFSQKIIKARGYRLMTIPYTEFDPNQRLVEKIKYLKEKIKIVVNS